MPFPRSRGGQIGGVGGIAGLVVMAIVLFASMRGGGGGGGGIGSGRFVEDASPGGTGLESSDEAATFASDAFSDIQDSWEGEFAASGQQFTRSRLVLFEDSVTSGCGPASSATGPFYCPADERVYIDLSFWDQLERDFGARGGDFAQAYVIAHEVGHHVQNLVGTNAEVQRLSAEDPSRRNDLSVALELQADCYAGVWANGLTERQGNVLEPGDIAEGLSAASAVGDDRIQERTQGRIDPESWTHGSAEQRQQWFTIGYEQGTPDACDTFS